MKAYSGGPMNGLNDIVNNCTRRRNNFGIVSSDPNLVEVLDEILSQRDFALTHLSFDSLVEDKPQDVYFIDLGGFDDLLSVAQLVKEIREQKPDSELVLLEPPSTLSKPQATPLKVTIENHLVTVYERPLPEKSSDYRRTLQRLVDHVGKFLAQPNLIKIGGSIFDLYDKDPSILLNLLGEIKKLHNEGYPIILTTGGGPRQDTERGVSEAYGTSDYSEQVLERQAENIAELLGDIAVYISPKEMGRRKFSPDYLESCIPVASLSGVPEIKDNESDTHTLAIGEKLGLYKAIFVKDTDGIFERDPNIPSKKIMAWRKQTNGNEFFPHIYASAILNGVISRVDSEGRGEHLIESGALMYLRDTKHLRVVQIINGNKPEMLCKALNGEFTGSYILKG